MPNSDRVKAEVAFIEKLFFASLAIVVAVTGWLVGEYSKANALMTAGAGVMVVSGLCFCAWACRKIYKLFGDLENV